MRKYYFASLDAKLKLALVLTVVAGGLEVMLLSGGVILIVQTVGCRCRIDIAGQINRSHLKAVATFLAKPV